MQIRTFDARTLDAAQTAVRRALGDEALILATESTATGIRITAAIEDPVPLHELLADDGEEVADAGVLRILAFHGVPAGLARRLAQAAAGAGSIEAGLAQALKPSLKLAPSAPRQLLVGPPGHGKTLAAVRLAHAALAAGRRPHVLGLRSGADVPPSPLAALLAATPLTVTTVVGANALRAALRDVGDGDWLVDADPLLVHGAADAAHLRAYVEAAGGHATLVVSVEGQPSALLETAMDHLALGCRAVLVTKLDATRRYGALVALAAAGVPLAGLGIGPGAGDALAQPTARGLARLLVRRAPVADGAVR